MVAWDKGEDLTRWKGSEVGEDPVWQEEGHLRQVIVLHFYPTGLNNSLSLQQEISVSLFLMALWLPFFPHSFCWICFPLRESKKVSFTRNSSCHSELQIGFFSDSFVHSFIQPTSEHLLPERLRVRLCAFCNLVKTLHLPLQNQCSNGEAQTSARARLPDGKC